MTIETKDKMTLGRHESGYTLIEVLISLTLFSVGMLAIASMQISGIRGNATAKWHTEASTWSADRLERLMTRDYAHADLTSGSHGPVTEGLYTINWTVSANDPINNVKTIDVTVSWKDGTMSKNNTFSFYKADL